MGVASLHTFILCPGFSMILICQIVVGKGLEVVNDLANSSVVLFDLTTFVNTDFEFANRNKQIYPQFGD